MFVAFDGIVFDILFLDGWQIDADMSSDGADFLRWHHTLDVTCVLNKDATAAWKFPPKTRTQQDWNRRQIQEFTSRLRTKAFQAATSQMKSGQIVGENPKKGNYPSGIIGGALSGIGQIPYILKSGKVVSPPAPVPSKVKTSANEGQWEKILTSIPFTRALAEQTGSSYITADGGPISNTDVNASPSVVQTSTAGDIGAGLGLGIGVVGGAALGSDVGKGIVGWGSDIIFGPDTKEIAESWWNQIKKTLEDLGSNLGIGPGDIFGQGRQPLAKLPFIEPPIKRKLNDPPLNLPAGSGNLGWTVPATFQELQDRLNQRGKTLAVWLNSGPDGQPEFMLYSPYQGFSTDALTGPRCKFMHIPAIHGNVTGILKLRFETWVAPPPKISFGVTGNPSNYFSSVLRGYKPRESRNTLTSGKQQKSQTGPTAMIDPAGVVVNNVNQAGIVGGALGKDAGQGQGGNVGGGLGNKIKNDTALPVGNDGNLGNNNLVLLTPPILSNRWTMRQVPDPATHLNTTIIEGTAHFRLDVLQKLRMSADQLRPFFMHPIPFGYVRMPPEVTILSDGASVQYTVVDIQQMMNNPGGQRWGIHSVKAQQTMSYNSPLDYVRAPFALTSIWNDVGKGLEGLGQMGLKII